MTELSARIVDAGWTLTWQVAFIAAGVWLLVTLFARRRPHLAAALWLLVIVKAVTPPVWTTPLNIWSLAPRSNAFAQMQDSTTTQNPSVQEINDPVAVSRIALRPDKRAEDADPQVVSAASVSDVANHAQSAAPSPGPILQARSLQWPVIILGVWFAGSLAFCWVVGVRALRLRSAMARSEYSPALTDRTARLSSRGRAGTTNVLLCDAVGPAACGIRRPLIMLPRSLAESLAAEQIDAVLAHELTHLQRHDIAIGWLQTLVQIVWWFHPAVWLANRRLTQAIEESCDLETLRRLQCRAADYARCLLAVIEHDAVRASSSLPIGIRAFEATRTRVRRVIETRIPATQPAWLPRVALVGGMLLTLPGAVTPLAGQSANVDELKPIEPARADGNRTLATAEDSLLAAHTNVLKEVEKEQLKLEHQHGVLHELNRPVTWAFTDSRLADVFKKISDDHRLNITIDVIALERVGVTLDMKINLSVSGVSLRSALKLLLDAVAKNKLEVIVTADAPMALKVTAASPRVSRLLSPDGTQIAYGQIAVGPDGEQKVRVIVGNVDGTDRKALPVDAENVDEVQWYGNDKIAYVIEHGEDGYRLMNLDGTSGGEIRMPAGCDSFFHQCLSPDGKKIAFCGNYFETTEKFANDDARRKYLKEHKEIEQQHGLFVVDLEKQTVKHVLDEIVANLPAWSADSKFLACGIGHYVKDYPLAIINVETGDVQRPDVKGVGPAWSPDGSRLAMTTDVVKGGSWLGGIPLDGALGVWNVAEGGRKLVLDGSFNKSDELLWNYYGSRSPVWSPDGEWIAYTAAHFVKQKGTTDMSVQTIRLVRPSGDDEKPVLDHAVDELAWAPDGQQLLWVHQGQFGIVRFDGVQPLTGLRAVPAGRYSITGKIVDQKGMPLKGVSVHVARGVGTLFSTEPVLTDAAGRYEIHFGPAMHSSSGPNLQAATVFASKNGYAEANLCRGGNLGMAEYRQKGSSDKDWGFVGIVYRDNPYQLDFKMEPASTITIDLVDSTGQPLVNYSIDLDGDLLPPSSSVLASSKTNDRGRVIFSEVPRQKFWFSIGGGRAEYRTEPINFETAGDYHYQLKYDDILGSLTVNSGPGRTAM